MKAGTPFTQFTLWRSETLFNIDFASYKLSHHSFSRHFHDHYVIELVITGADSFYCEGKNYTAGKNELVLINPGEVHTGSTVPGETLEYFSLYPDKKAFRQVADTLNITIPGDLIFRQSLLDRPALTGKLRGLFDAIRFPAPPLRQQEIFFDCMYELLQPLNRNDCQTINGHPKDRRVNLVIEWLLTHFREKISLQQLAGLVQLDPFHFVRLFKKNTGLSPYDFLLNLRTGEGRQLLRKGWKVGEAASHSGFYDSSHFNRIFYKSAGTSPKSFRLSKSQYRTSFAGL